MNSSLSTTSPDWPTNWPKDSFRASRILITIAIVIGVSVAVAIPLLIAGFASGMFVPPVDPDKVLVPGMLGQLAIEAAIVVVLLLRLRGDARLSLRDLGFRALGGRDLLVAVIGAVAMVVIVEGLSSVIFTIAHNVFHITHDETAVALLKAKRDSLGFVIFFTLFGCVAAPIAEETVFRIYVFNAARRYGGFWIGAIVSGLLFGLAHGDMFVFFPLAVGGMILAAVYARTGCAYASMITHGLFNLTSIVALIFFPSLAT